MPGYNTRRRVHDEIAKPEVEKILIANGCTLQSWGTETDEKDVRDALLKSNDTSSLLLRYRPDILAVHQGLGSLFCEVKSEYNGYLNYAIEFRSYAMALEWGQRHKILYAFVDISGEHFENRSVWWSWAESVNFPRFVSVPTRSDAHETRQWIEQKYPTIRCEFSNRVNGSGTPYFLLPKDWGGFKYDFEIFIDPIRTDQIDTVETSPKTVVKQLSLFG